MEFSSQRKAARRAREAASRIKQEADNERLLKALYRPRQDAKGRVDRFLEWHTTPEALRWGPNRMVHSDPAFTGVDKERLTEEFFDVMRVVEQRAPRLLEKEYVEALSWACRVPYVLKRTFVRPPSEWEPKGKGRDSLFRSLVSHLLAKYPVTPLLWTPFFDKGHAYRLLPLVGFVAGGGSLYDYVTGRFPSPDVKPNERPFDPFPIALTRKMCHELLTMPSEGSFVGAIRRIQVKAAGGNERLLQALLGSHHYRTLGAKATEDFMVTVIQWLAPQLINPSEVGPLLDYIAHRRAEDATFSMKGRSAVTLLRAMHAWHDGLTRVRSVSKAVFKESGFQGCTLSMDRKEHGKDVHEVWRIRELLTARQLLEEGRAQSHCVYSYERSCVAGTASIWSMTMEDGLGETGNWRMITIEVINANKQIVQARGRFNRVASAREHGIMARWAALNGLTINLGKWG